MRLPTHTMCVELGLLACVWQHIPCVLSMHWGFPLPLPGVSCRMVCGSWVCVGGPASGRAGAGVGALVCVCVCVCVLRFVCVSVLVALGGCAVRLFTPRFGWASVQRGGSHFFLVSHPPTKFFKGMGLCQR